MINNRQGGRRRGRGGQRGPNLGNQPGNRQDNRQRGNAAQLLEKYKSLARDAQLAGDRIQSEYFLQYAEHYHRVLGESRARYEEQRRQRGEDLDDDESDEELVESSDEQAEASEGDDRPERRERRDRGRRPDRERRSEGEGERERASRNAQAMNGGDERIPMDVLPPAIGSDEDGEPDEAVTAPRRRTRRARPVEDEGDIAPAA